MTVVFAILALFLAFVLVLLLAMLDGGELGDDPLALAVVGLLAAGSGIGALLCLVAATGAGV